MHALKDYEIPYTGLKPGKHHFNFKVNDSFFEAFEYSELKHGNLTVDIELEKQSTMLILNFSIAGTMSTLCDRCAESLDVEITANERLIVKFGSEPFNETDEILILPQSEHKVKVAQPIFEFIELNLPHKRLHEEGECNKEMLSKLQEHAVQDGETTDPRWAALKALKE